MKLRSTMILLLTALSAGIIVWLYAIATRKGGHKDPSAWQATLSDLNACASQHYIRAVRYDHYAHVANTEKRSAHARLFHALALSERISEGNCATAVTHLGGEYRAPQRVVVVHGTAAENLDRAIAEKSGLTAAGTAAIERAVNTGNRYAARTMIRSAANNRIHLLLLRQATAADGGTSIYFVCPVCGNCWLDRECDPACPHCQTLRHEFIPSEL